MTEKNQKEGSRKEEDVKEKISKMGKLRVVMGTDTELSGAARPMGELREMGA